MTEHTAIILGVWAYACTTAGRKGITNWYMLVSVALAYVVTLIYG